MNILTLDTSTSWTSIAVGSESDIAAEYLFRADRTLSSRLLPNIETMLSQADLSLAAIDLFGCAIGPGSFTGVRAGVATIQGLALATGKPCVGFSSLAVRAMNIPLAHHPVCVLIDARKNEVYAGLYDCSSTIPAPLFPECVLPPLELAERLRAQTEGTIILAGDGVGRYYSLLADRLGDRAMYAPSSCHHGRAGNGIQLALHTHASGIPSTPRHLVPTYIRPSEAELNRSRTL